MRLHPFLYLLALFASAAACSSSPTHATGSGQTSSGAGSGGQHASTGSTTTSGAGAGGTTSTSGTSSTGITASTSSGGGGGASVPAPFTYGLNLGYYNSSLSDTTEGAMGQTAGADSHRHKLPEYFLDQWGNDIHVSELSAMLKAGERDIVCNIIGPSAAHSNAPAGASDDDLEHYSPTNLYQPIFTSSGDVNPDNYWAAFVQTLVTTYSPYIHSWEVWNEPDQVGGNYQATETWTTSPPKPSDLIWWNDTIFAYIRMLHVTYAVVHKLDPQGKVTLGGIGYPAFLNAILRYTDDPTAGAVSSDYPDKGGAYFDVVSYHYYPTFTPGNSDVGAAGLVALHDQLEAELTTANVTGKTFIVTESGAPRYALGTSPGGVDYAHNYLAKAMALAQAAGVQRIDWFILGDSADPGASTDPDSYMGLYENLSNVMSPAAATITPTGVAYATMGHLLEGSTFDAATTQSLGLASGTKGVALLTPTSQHAFVVWAETASGESGTGTVSLPASSTATAYAWDYSTSMKPTTLSPSAGKVQVSVTSSPTIVLAP